MKHEDHACRSTCREVQVNVTATRQPRHSVREVGPCGRSDPGRGSRRAPPTL